MAVDSRLKLIIIYTPLSMVSFNVYQQLSNDKKEAKLSFTPLGASSTGVKIIIPAPTALEIERNKEFGKKVIEVR